MQPTIRDVYAGPSREMPAGRDTHVAAIQALKTRDNHTNFGYLAGVYMVIAATIAATIWSHQAVADAGLGWWWNIPATLLAIIIIGGSQHQLGGFIHESAHFMLFKNRWLNEIASDWLAAFSIYTSTYQYRIHHLAHHQFVNDPERDPDLSQHRMSGHWPDFPMPHIDFLMTLLKALLPWRLLHYAFARARYGAAGFEGSPYYDAKLAGSKWPLRFGILFVVGVPIALARLTRWGLDEAAFGVLAGGWSAVVAYYMLAPSSEFPRTRLEPVVSHRATAIGRVSYLAIAYGALSLLQLNGYPAWSYFELLWILPLFSTFALFMMLRQWLQHGNTDRGRYTNSRIYMVNPLLRYCIFPNGQEYHLTHHIHASVPHYNLKRLHEELGNDPAYRAKAKVLHGFFFGRNGTTIVDGLGPEHAPRTEKAYVDDATLEYADVQDAAAVRREAELSERAD